MKSKKRSWQQKFFSENTSLVFLFSGIGVLVVAFIFLFLNASGTFNPNSKFDFVLLNNFGAFVGGLVGSLWALAGVILFYIALQDQKKYIETNQQAFEKQVEALDVQINEFILQKDELRLTREVFTEQSKTQKLQRFETTFFNLINLFFDVRKQLELNIDKNVTEFYIEFIPANSKSIESPSKDKLIGSEALKYAHWKLSGCYKFKKNEMYSMQSADNNLVINDFAKVHYEEILKASYKLYNSGQTIQVKSYVNSFIALVNFASEIGDHESLKYVRIIRSQISDPEKALILYILISTGRQETLRFLVRSNFFEGLHSKVLFDRVHKELIFNAEN